MLDALKKVPVLFPVTEPRFKINLLESEADQTKLDEWYSGKPHVMRQTLSRQFVIVTSLLSQGRGPYAVITVRGNLSTNPLESWYNLKKVKPVRHYVEN